MPELEQITLDDYSIFWW